MSKKKYTFDIGNNRLLTISKKYDQLSSLLLLLHLAGRRFYSA